MSKSEYSPSTAQIKAARALLGWSQRELARRAGVALSTIADFERGFRDPMPNNLQALVNSLAGAGIKIGRDGSVRGRGPSSGPGPSKGRALGWDTDLADAPEPIEQCPHMVGLRCCRGIPQPGEWRRRECRIGYEQRVEFSKLRRCTV
jgi:transcriptional regulator with XRE-family HTH domain